MIKEKYDRFVSLTSETLSKFRMNMVMALWKVVVGLVHESPDLDIFKVTTTPHRISIILKPQVKVSNRSFRKSGRHHTVRDSFWARESSGSFQ